MRILLDENVSKVAARTLAAQEHDVRRVARSIGGMRDADVLALARREERLLVTFDAGFTELVYTEQLPPPPGVVLLRMPLAKAAQAPTLLGIISAHDVIGFFTVVAADEVRATPLPRSP